MKFLNNFIKINISKQLASVKGENNRISGQAESGSGTLIYVIHLSQKRWVGQYKSIQKCRAIIIPK